MPLPDAGSGPSSRHRRRKALLWAGGALLTAFVLWLHIWHDPASFFDLLVYQRGGAEVLHGTGRLYDFRFHTYPFTYPPAAALAFQPLALAPSIFVETVVTVVQLGCLLAIWILAIGATPALSPRKDVVLNWPLLWAVAVSATAVEPVLRSIRLGQINLVLLLVILFDLLGARDRLWRGALTGLAAAFKLTPLVFLALLAFTGQWRALRNAATAFAGAAALGFLLLPAESLRYWTKLVFTTSRIGPVERGNNQSVTGLLLRLGFESGSASTTLLWLVVAGVFGAAALAAAVRCWRRDQRLLAISLTGLIGLIASPVSWSHHWVWCIPIGVGLISLGHGTGHAMRGWGAACAWWSVFVVAPQTHLPTSHGVELTWTPVQQILGSTYLWSSVLLLAFVSCQLSTQRATAPMPHAVEDSPIRH